MPGDDDRHSMIHFDLDAVQSCKVMLFTVQDKLGFQGLVDNTSGFISILVSKASADQMTVFTQACKFTMIPTYICPSQ